MVKSAGYWFLFQKVNGKKKIKLLMQIPNWMLYGTIIQKICTIQTIFLTFFLAYSNIY